MWDGTIKRIIKTLSLSEMGSIWRVLCMKVTDWTYFVCHVGTGVEGKR